MRVELTPTIWRTFRALSNPIRLNLLRHVLADQGYCVTGLADAVDGLQANHGVLMIRNVYPSNTGHPSTPKRETLNFNR